jgi:hypothetical protein
MRTRRKVKNNNGRVEDKGREERGRKGGEMEVEEAREVNMKNEKAKEKGSRRQRKNNEGEDGKKEKEKVFVYSDFSKMGFME